MCLQILRRVAICTISVTLVTVTFGHGQDEAESPSGNTEMLKLLGEARAQLKRNPHLAFWHIEASTAQIKVCELENAESHVREAIRLEPDNPNQLAQLADVLLRKGKIHDAIREVERAAQMDPDNPTFDCDLGYYYELAGRNKEAVTSYGSCVRRVGKGKGFYLDKTGTGWSLEGSAERAQEGINRIRAGRAKSADQVTTPCSPDADEPRAREDLARSLKELTRNPHARYWHTEAATAHYFLEDYTAAHNQVLLAIKEEPEFRHTYFLAASIAERRRDPDSQIAFLRKFLSFDPRNPVALYKLARVLEQKEEYEEAEEKLQAALDSLASSGPGDFYNDPTGTPYPIEEVRRDGSQSLRRILGKLSDRNKR